MILANRPKPLSERLIRAEPRLGQQRPIRHRRTVSRGRSIQGPILPRWYCRACAALCSAVEVTGSMLPAGNLLWLTAWHRACDAGADQLVADKPQGKADQDRREDRDPRPLCRLSDGRDRHSEKFVRRDFAAHRGVTAASGTINHVRSLHLRVPSPTHGRDAS